MNTFVKGLSAVLTFLLLLPATAGYAVGMGVLIKLSFSANPSMYLVIAFLLVPGWALYAVWRLWFNVFASPSDSKMIEIPPSIAPSVNPEALPHEPLPAYLWAAIVIGAVIAAIICAPFIPNAIEDSNVIIFYGGPLLALPCLIYFYVARKRK